MQNLEEPEPKKRKAQTLKSKYQFFILQKI